MKLTVMTPTSAAIILGFVFGFLLALTLVRMGVL